MAISDEDWNKFLDSTEEDPDEVETDDESEDEDDETDTGDKKKKTDKSTEDEDDTSDADEENSDKDEDDADEGDEEDDKSDYKPRLKQFFKKDGSLDAEKIEKSYIESGKKAVELDEKLKKVSGDYDALLKAIKAKPDVAEQLFGKDAAKKISTTDTGDKSEQSPLLRHLEAQLSNQQRKEYSKFVDEHPEAVTDPDKIEKIGKFLKLYSDHHRANNDGEIPSMAESLEAAYKFHGWDLEIDDKEAIASAAKKRAATRHSSNGRKKGSKKEVSMGEQFFADKLGVKLK